MQTITLRAETAGGGDGAATSGGELSHPIIANPTHRMANIVDVVFKPMVAALLGLVPFTPKDLIFEIRPRSGSVVGSGP